MESPASRRVAGFSRGSPTLPPGPDAEPIMSSIHNIGGNSPVQKIQSKPVQKPAETDATGATTPTRGPDKLELSGLSHLFETLKSGGDIRSDKVAQIKS